MCCNAHDKPSLMTEGEICRLYTLRQQREDERVRAYRAEMEADIQAWMRQQVEARVNEIMIEIDQPTKVEAPVAKELVLA